MESWTARGNDGEVEESKINIGDNQLKNFHNHLTFSTFFCCWLPLLFSLWPFPVLSVVWPMVDDDDDGTFNSPDQQHSGGWRIMFLRVEEHLIDWNLLIGALVGIMIVIFIIISDPGWWRWWSSSWLGGVLKKCVLSPHGGVNYMNWKRLVLMPFSLHNMYSRLIGLDSGLWRRSPIGHWLVMWTLPSTVRLTVLLSASSYQTNQPTIPILHTYICTTIEKYLLVDAEHLINSTGFQFNLLPVLHLWNRRVLQLITVCHTLLSCSVHSMIFPVFRLSSPRLLLSTNCGWTSYRSKASSAED